MGAYEAHGFINNINTGARPPGGMLHYVVGDDGSHGVPRYNRFYPGAGNVPGGACMPRTKASTIAATSACP